MAAKNRFWELKFVQPIFIKHRHIYESTKIKKLAKAEAEV